MARRGNKPKPPILKLVTGNPGKRPIPAHGSEISVREQPLEPLKKLTRIQQRLWDRFINSAWWLSDFDVPKAHTWVCLQWEFMQDGKNMNAARLGQLRLLESELGLDPGERARMGIGDRKQSNPVDEFFDH